MRKKDLVVPPVELPATFPHKEFPLHSYIQEISTVKKKITSQGLLIVTTRTATEMVKISTVHYKNIQKRTDIVENIKVCCFSKMKTPFDNDSNSMTTKFMILLSVYIPMIACTSQFIYLKVFLIVFLEETFFQGIRVTFDTGGKHTIIYQS